MWILENDTSFAAERTWVRDENGAETWIVVVKATFDIDQGGALSLKEEQPPVHRVPLFRGDPATTSLITESELLHKKCTTDVLLLGSAYAPRGRAASSVAVRLKLGGIDKSLIVYGDRRIEHNVIGVAASSPTPFTQMPLLYERAFGGTDLIDPDASRHAWQDENPVGVGFASRPQHIAGTLAPNIEYPGAPYRSCNRGRPAGFGPIARHWQPRRGLAGTYDEAWENSRMPLLPSDFDDRFYQAAPLDQQTAGFLRGGEPVHLENLTPEGSLDFILPRIVLGFSTRLAGKVVEHRGMLHTVLLQPDLREVAMVWHTSLLCHGQDHKLYSTTVRLKNNVASDGQTLGKDWR